MNGAHTRTNVRMRDLVMPTTLPQATCFYPRIFFSSQLARHTCAENEHALFIFPHPLMPAPQTCFQIEQCKSGFHVGKWISVLTGFAMDCNHRLLRIRANTHRN